MAEDNKNTKKPRQPKEVVVVKNTTDYQRMKLDRLMRNPDKPVQLPERIKEKKTSDPPDFVRNVMGSSAGAGSGEFHVYRHIRRREYARQKQIQVMSDKERKDEEFQSKLETNMKLADERTDKKRAKRLKKKSLAKSHKKTKLAQLAPSSDDSDSSTSDTSEYRTSEVVDSDNANGVEVVKDRDSNERKSDSEIEGGCNTISSEGLA